MALKKQKLGFTLIEMIIAIGILGFISAMTAKVLIDIANSQKILNMHQAVVQDSRVILGLLATEIQSNAIDYEEYYNNKKYGYDFGKNYGKYAEELFYVAGNPTGMSFETAIDCSSAKCGEGHLNLISPNGMEKIVYALKKTDPQYDEHVLSVMHLYGCDSNEDGIAEKFIDAKKTCGDKPGEYTIDELSTGTNLFGGLFAPVSSTRTDIVDLKFYITPVNDPHKAYAMPEYIDQPSVKIVMSVKPSKKRFGNTAEKINPILLQTTVAPSTIAEVKSYKP